MKWIGRQLIIWFVPFSFVNSVTQYVLIAVDQQRFLTKAFLIGVTFDIVANLIFVPIYSYRDAAVVTILSKLGVSNRAEATALARRRISSLPIAGGLGGQRR